MRGFPLINAGIILLALAALMIPLVQLTSAPPAVQIEVDKRPEETSTPITLSVRWAHRPEKLSVHHLGKVLWRWSGEDDAECETSLPISSVGIDLLVTVEWPEGTPESAIELSVEPRALETQKGILWGEGATEEVLTFKWEDL